MRERYDFLTVGDGTLWSWTLLATTYPAASNKQYTPKYTSQDVAHASATPRPIASRSQ